MSPGVRKNDEKQRSEGIGEGSCAPVSPRRGCQCNPFYRAQPPLQVKVKGCALCPSATGSSLLPAFGRAEREEGGESHTEVR